MSLSTIEQPEADLIGIAGFVDKGLLTPEMMKALVISTLDREPIHFEELDQILTSVFTAFSSVLHANFDANFSTGNKTISPEHAPYVLGDLLHLLKTQLSNFLGKKDWAAQIELTEQKGDDLIQKVFLPGIKENWMIICPTQNILLSNKQSMFYELVRNQSIPCTYQLRYRIVN